MLSVDPDVDLGGMHLASKKLLPSSKMLEKLDIGLTLRSVSDVLQVQQ
jgi:hypothetical protein